VLRKLIPSKNLAIAKNEAFNSTMSQGNGNRSTDAGDRLSKRIILTSYALIVLAAFVFALYPILKPDLQRAHFEKNLKQRISPEELRAWALGLLKTYDTNKTYDNAHITNSHPALEGQFRNPPVVWWYSASQTDTEFVRVTYGGGGFGHFGVEIGPTNRAMPDSRTARQYSFWAPGIYFFDGQ